MSADDRWQRLKKLVAEAQSLDPGRRDGFLASACSGDETLLAEARTLVGLSDETAGFLDESALGDVEREPLAAGAEVGPYRVVRPLGAGGMGDVYLAERSDGTYEQQVAIKVIRLVGGPAEIQDRFLSERRLLAELRHPHIAPILDAGALDDGRPYFVMEYVDGEPVDMYCRRRGLSVRERLALMADVAGAVAHAHRHLVVHRDLKPGNIFVDTDGRPKLLDFGVAKDLSEVGKTPSTRLLVPMTPEYASPEQLAGGAVTTATDVYALGVVLYELVTGSSPFGGVDDPLSGRSRSSPPSRPSSRVVRGDGPDRKSVRRQLSGDLDALILKALDPDPAARYSSMEALERDLRHYLDGLPLEARGGRLYRVGKWVRRHWKATAAAVLATALVSGWWLERAERREAQAEADLRLKQSRQVADATREVGEFVIEMLRTADPSGPGGRNPVAERLLHDTAEILDKKEAFDKAPLIRAALLGTVGQIYRRLGEHEKAEPLLRECLEIRRRQDLPVDPLEKARAANNLATALRGLKRYEESRDLLLEAAGILTASLGLDVGSLDLDALDVEDEETRQAAAILSSTWSNLAGIEKELGRLGEAVDFFRLALEAKKRLYPQRPDLLATARKNLAVGLIAAGRLDEAAAELRSARELVEMLERPDRSLDAGVAHYEGVLAREQGRIVEARALLERAYEIRRSLKGEDDRQTLETLAALESLDP